ncbi:MAG: recombinase family protein [Rhodospirillaceae bacterium]|jgi:DNA invertase Pin-like site-specific DNA recombinase|nr:recombinase family protein [Rhodospirillales bacterium]MBT4117359.1 recombinase family protein [Rhodospirillaceae bacterium]MBT5840358.1 recombinase family protein [Rhodospirillaceae bacterium]MBT7235727.1 recombinase family protein [Rhodospirillaceae bacterium]MBT7570406.1 recombinase family protein [Rhodospirillaceae bacterium]
MAGANNCIAYYRVSTDRQGKSGLGLEAQKETVNRYLESVRWNLVGEYVEVESGKKKNRPELEVALQVCKKEKATLLIAKLDRLARNVYFISGLMESGVDFVAADNPHANKLMIHLLAAFAEHEREQISQRTKDALAAAKARGVELGKNGKVLAKMNQEKADTFANGMAATVRQLQNDGFTTIRQLADELNRREISSANGALWHIPTVHRLLRRLEKTAA